MKNKKKKISFAFMVLMLLCALAGVFAEVAICPLTNPIQTESVVVHASTPVQPELAAAHTPVSPEPIITKTTDGINLRENEVETKFPERVEFEIDTPTVVNDEYFIVQENGKNILYKYQNVEWTTNDKYVKVGESTGSVEDMIKSLEEQSKYSSKGINYVNGETFVTLTLKDGELVKDTNRGIQLLPDETKAKALEFGTEKPKATQNAPEDATKTVAIEEIDKKLETATGDEKATLEAEKKKFLEEQEAAKAKSTVPTTTPQTVATAAATPPPAVTASASMNDYQKCLHTQQCNAGYGSDGKRVYKILTLNGKEYPVTVNEAGYSSQTTNSQTISNIMGELSKLSKADLEELKSTPITDSETKIALALQTGSNLKDLNIDVSTITDKNTLLLIIDKGAQSDSDMATHKFITTSSAEDLKNAFKTINSDKIRSSLMANALSEPDKSPVSVEDLCNANQKACGKQLFELSVQGGELGAAAQQNFLTMIEKGKVDITVEQAGEIMYKGGVSGEDMRKWATAANGRDCDTFFGSMLCSITQDQSSRQVYMKGLMDDVTGIKNSMLVAPKDGVHIGATTKWLGLATDKEGTAVCAGMKISSKECQDAIKAVCMNPKTNKENKECVADANAKLKRFASIPDTNIANQKILFEFAKNSDLKFDDKSCEGVGDENNKNCIAYLEQQINDACANDDVKCSYLIAGLNKAMGQQVVDVGLRYSAWSALKNPDQGGLKAAKFFGFEADYSGLPDWLKQDMATSICSAKIDGYLDKEIANDGGVTKYGCENELDTNPDDKCLTVLADVRGQRSKITPDNKTLITYSYYLKAPSGQDVMFIVASSYKLKNGEVVKDIIVNKTDVSAGGNSKGFDTIELPVKSRDDADPKSFRIGIGAFYKDKSTYANIAAPIIIANPEAYDVSNERAAENVLASSQANAPETLSANDLLELMNI